MGILARCWGRVIASRPGDPSGGSFRIDDGSRWGDGVLVLHNGEAPATGAYAFVTGVISSILVGDECKPMLRVSDPAGVTVWPP